MVSEEIVYLKDGSKNEVGYLQIWYIGNFDLVVQLYIAK